ncbi:MAG TPA: DUF4292 domain-containing protein [Candidatus Binataceae bacterium]|nr:DUF4292 domain-containing protein [Candidatus Binataceae bacterium]
MESAAAGVSARERLINSVESSAIMEYSGPDGHIKARERITLRRPADLRVEALSPLGVALIVAAGPSQIEVFDPSRNTLMRGPATADTLDRFARIPMEPGRAVRLLMGLPPEDGMLASAPAQVSDNNGVRVLSYPSRDGGFDELGFSQDRLALVRERASSGEIVYEVSYSDYRDVGAAEFPFQIDASFPRTGARLKLRYENPQVDQPIPDSAFILSPGPTTRLLDGSDASGG